MADTFAKRTHVNPKRGRGKVIMSEGVAPAENILPDPSLSTLLKDYEPYIANHFEVIMLKGTIVTCYDHTFDAGPLNGKKALVAKPCIGATGCEVDNVILTVADGTVAYEAYDHAAGAGEASLGIQLLPKGLRSGASAADTLAGVQAKPLGVLAQDAYRPFEYGEIEGISFITHGYVEWPLVKKVESDDDNTVYFDNTDLAVGDYVKPDSLGRPVKWRPGVDPNFLRIGRVVKKDVIGADFDYGLLNYFQLPQSAGDMADGLLPDMIKAVFTGKKINTATNAVTNVFGLQPNVDGLLTLVDPADAVAGATGIVRVQLLNL